MGAIIEYFLRFTNKLGEILFMREIKRLRLSNELFKRELMRRHKVQRWGDFQDVDDSALTTEELEICAFLNVSTKEYAWNKQKIRIENITRAGRSLS
jgi:hypothetical protein